MKNARLSDQAIRERATKLVSELGPNRAAKALGVNRITALSLAAGAPVLAATFALVRETLANATNRQSL